MKKEPLPPQNIKFTYKYKFTSSYEIKKSPDNKYFATAGSSIAIWDANTGKKIISFGQLKNPYHLNFSHSGKLLAAKNTSGKVALFDMIELKHLKSYVPTKSEGCELYFTPDDKYIVSADWDGYIYIVDIKTGLTEIISSGHRMFNSLQHDNFTNQYTFHTNNIIKGKFQYEVITWKYPFDKNEPIFTQYKHDYVYVAYSCANKCNAVIIRGIPNELILMDENCKKVIKKLDVLNRKGKKSNVEKVTWSTDGKFLALIADAYICRNDNFMYEVQIIEFDSFNIIDNHLLPNACFIELSKDGKQLFVGGWNNGYYYDLSSSANEDTENKPQITDIKCYIEENGITKELLSQVGDSELVEALFFTSEKIYGNIEHKSEAEWLEKLPPLYKLAHLIYWFDNETSEGGLSQYIFNSQCELCAQLKESFKLLELPEHVKIINKAVKLYKSQELDMYDAKWEKLNEKCEELDENPIDALFKYICSIYN